MPLHRPSTRSTLLLLLASLLVLVIAIFLSKQAPPACARLLPESQAILYFNLRPLRAATHFDQHPVPHDPDYQHFINASGIDFERDLDEAAFALQRSANPLGPNGPVAYSEVFVGRFDRARLTSYLEASANAREIYSGKAIYSIPNAGRIVRVAILDRRMVAISNTPSAEQIHSILDRARMTLLPFSSSSSLLSEHYRDVPLLSLAWGLGEVGLPFTDHGELRVFGLTLPFRLDTTFIASLRWSGALRLRVEEIAPSETAAAAAAGSLQALVNLGRMAENNLPGALTDQNARALLNSASVTHARNRAVIDATLPAHFFEKLVAPPDAVVPSESSEPTR